MPGQPGAGVPNGPSGPQGAFPGQQMVPGQQMITGQTMPGQMIPGQPGMGGVRPGQPGNTGNSAAGGGYVGVSGPYIGGSATPAQPVGNGNTGMPVGFPGAPVNSQTGGVSPYPTTPGANGAPPGFAQPGLNQNPQAQNAAAAMIQQILTQPRPGGAPQAGQMGMIGGGIAGFASTADDEGIMVYNDRTNYGEWEFIFDPAKMKPLFNPNNGALGTPASQMGNMSGTQVPGQIGSPGQSSPSPFGSTPNANPSPFGSAPNANPSPSPFGQNPIGPGRQ
jgi:hypothetical protein